MLSKFAFYKYTLSFYVIYILYIYYIHIIYICFYRLFNILIIFSCSSIFQFFFILLFDRFWHNVVNMCRFSFDVLVGGNLVKELLKSWLSFIKACPTSQDNSLAVQLKLCCWGCIKPKSFKSVLCDFSQSIPYNNYLLRKDFLQTNQTKFLQWSCHGWFSHPFNCFWCHVKKG